MPITRRIYACANIDKSSSCEVGWWYDGGTSVENHDGSDADPEEQRQVDGEKVEHAPKVLSKARRGFGGGRGQGCDSLRTSSEMCGSARRGQSQKKKRQSCSGVALWRIERSPAWKTNVDEKSP